MCSAIPPVFVSQFLQSNPDLLLKYGLIMFSKSPYTIKHLRSQFVVFFCSSRKGLLTKFPQNVRKTKCLSSQSECCIDIFEIVDC